MDDIEIKTKNQQIRKLHKQLQSIGKAIQHLHQVQESSKLIDWVMELDENSSEIKNQIFL